MYSIYTFDELLPHHIRYVIKCFRGFDHFYETRADNGLLEYIQGFDKRASLPHQQTCLQILEVRALPHLPHPPVPKPCTVRPRWLTPACTFSSVFIYNKPTNSNALDLTLRPVGLAQEEWHTTRPRSGPTSPVSGDRGADGREADDHHRQAHQDVRQAVRRVDK